MKAVRVHEYHRPPSVDDVPVPEITAPGQVIVRIGGAGVCRTDLHLVDGWFEDILPAERPFTLGHENAGWVEAVAGDVTGVRIGQAVIAHPLGTCGMCRGCRRGEDMYCAGSAFPGVTVDGGYAEYLVTSQRALVPLAEGLDPADVAPYADAGLTAMRAVRKAARHLDPKDVAVVIGVGGLGHIGIQLLREMTPARIVAVDPSTPARDLALSLGAEVACLPEDAIATVSALSEDLGAAAVVDFVGEGDTPTQSAEMLRQGGTYYVVGYGGELGLPAIQAVLKELTVVGNLVGSHADLDELMGLVARGRLTLHTTRYPLTQAPQALDDLAAGRIVGRAVLVPA